MVLILADKTKQLRRGFFDVQNSVGVGRDEEDFHQAMRLWLRENGVPAASKQPHSLELYGEVAHKLFPDFVAWNQMTIELKAIQRSPGQTEYVQLFDYLKCRQDRLGLLVNMGLDRVHVERVVYEERSTQLQEDWSYWSGQIDGHAREVGLIVRKVLQDVYQQHTTGYGDEVIRKLILFGLRHHELSIVESPEATACYRDVVLRESALDCLLIEDCIVLTFTALFDSNEFNMNRGKSFLNALNLRWGIAANFGKTEAQFTGLRNMQSSHQ